MLHSQEETYNWQSEAVPFATALREGRKPQLGNQRSCLCHAESHLIRGTFRFIHNSLVTIGPSFRETRHTPSGRVLRVGRVKARQIRCRYRILRFL